MDSSHMAPSDDAVQLPAGRRRVFVRNLVLGARIGAYRRERNGRQRIRINLELIVVDEGKDLEDRLENVFNYERLAGAARELANGPHVNLVETLAERLAALCLADPRARTVLVRIEKLDVFADAESVGVEIRRDNPVPPPAATG